MEKEQVPHHEKLFGEIAGKLSELGIRKEREAATKEPETKPIAPNRMEKLQDQLRKSQDDLKSAQTDLEFKLKSFDSVGYMQNDLQQEFGKIYEQVEIERNHNTKISSDLARSLELNLKLQFELEEVRAKANQILNEERKHNAYLNDKLQTNGHELELARALQLETKSEFTKASDRLLTEKESFRNEIASYQNRIHELTDDLHKTEQKNTQLDQRLHEKTDECEKLSETLKEYQMHSEKQNDLIRNISEVAEKKIIELKLTLDKKVLESQEYYGHLQTSLNQLNVLKQENAALKEYIAKIASLHQSSVSAAR